MPRLPRVDRTQPAKSVAAGEPAARCDACHPSAACRAPRAGCPPGLPRAAARAPPERPPEVQPPDARRARRRLRGVPRRRREGGLATRLDLPKMALCLACHDGKQSTSRCSACHVTEPDGRLRTDFATAAGGGGRHGAARALGRAAGLRRPHCRFAPITEVRGGTSGTALSCHKRASASIATAAACEPADIHPSDYVDAARRRRASRNTPDCSSCHRTQTFCVGCHQRSGVAADPSGGVPGTPARNPFGTGTRRQELPPAGLGAMRAARAMKRPPDQARRNIRTCVSCHREESCLACHSTDPTHGMSVSPHGPGFSGTSRCRALSSRNRRVCLKCHALSAPEIDCEMP